MQDEQSPDSGLHISQDNMEVEGQTPSQPATGPDNKRRRLGVLIIVLVMLALGAGLTWLLLKEPGDKNASQQTNEQGTQATTQLLPEDVTNGLKDDFSKKYTLIEADADKQPAKGEMSVRLDKFAPVYKTEGYDFYNDYNGGSTLVVMPYAPSSEDANLPREVDMAIRTEIANKFIKLGLEKKETRGSESDGTATEIYIGKGLICTIEAPSAATSPSSASCGQIDKYEQAATEIKPLADVLPNITASTALRDLKITDSSVSGYQRATLGQGDLNGVGGSAALFYRKDKGTWKYFTNTQETIACDRYNTADLRSAYKGEPCYTADDEISKVQ